RIRIHPDAIRAGVAAMRGSCSIAVDVRMVEVALDQDAIGRLRCEAHCAIGRPEVIEAASANRVPRAVMAMRALRNHLDQGIAVIGTAPTALLELLDMIDAGQV